MQQMSEVTPVVQLQNGTFDLDVLKNSYTNVRWGVSVDRLITVDAKYEANLPGLSFDYYGDTSYWRAILAFNGLYDPISDIVVGTVLGLPSVASLDQYFAAKSNRSASSGAITI